jgi:hypothetical protein
MYIFRAIIIPAKAGIQYWRAFVDSGFRRNEGSDLDAL